MYSNNSESWSRAHLWNICTILKRRCGGGVHKTEEAIQSDKTLASLEGLEGKVWIKQSEILFHKKFGFLRR